MPDHARPDAPSGDPPGDPPADPADDPPTAAAPRPAIRARRERKSMLLRLDPDVHDALARWAADELRSTNAHLEYLLRRALTQAGRLPPPGS
jgi:hypothetical protein